MARALACVLVVALSIPATASAGIGGSLGEVCEDGKLLAFGRKVEADLKCYKRASDCRHVDAGCLDRARQQFVRELARAEASGCYGPDDGRDGLLAASQEALESALDRICVPEPCGEGPDRLSCGGTCGRGTSCRSVGQTCGCYADVFACDGPSSSCEAGGIGFCARHGETCDPATCTCSGPAECAEQPPGSGIAAGFCKDGDSCVFDGWSAHCVPDVFSCEGAGSWCSLGVPFGLCPERDQVCDPATCTCE